MTWKYESATDGVLPDALFLTQFINFLQSALTQRIGAHASHRPVRPEFVPSQVRVTKTIRGGIPFSKVLVEPGIYACSHNQWGAISVHSNDGSLLGVKPDECVVQKMERNTHFDEDKRPA